MPPRPILLIRKARPNDAIGDLFAAPVMVEGHMRGSAYVAPYSARRLRRRAEQPPSDHPDLFRREAPPRLFADDPPAEGLTGGTCAFCGQPERVAIGDIWSDHNFTLDTCCPELLEHISARMDGDPAFADAVMEHVDAEGLTGRTIRRVAYTGEGAGPVLLDYEPEVRPIDRKTAQAFVARWHRHNPPLVADVFRAGVWNGTTLLGVVVVGAPVARGFMDRFARKELIEARRLCIRTDLPRELTWRAASTLYRHAAEEAERRGYRSIITYTLASEDGMSLRYARWKPEARIRGKSWNTPARPRKDNAPTEDKVRWIKRLSPTPPMS
jgi:hypothetical protein